jgi:hypothetical protein
MRLRSYDEVRRLTAYLQTVVIGERALRGELSSPKNA